MSRASSRKLTRLGALVGVSLFCIAVAPVAQAEYGFVPTGSLASARMQHTSTLLLNGKVLVTGGYNYSGSLSSAELYDPASGAFTATGSMTTGRYLQTATLLPSGKVLILSLIHI